MSVRRTDSSPRRLYEFVLEDCDVPTALLQIHDRLFAIVLVITVRCAGVEDSVEHVFELLANRPWPSNA